MPSRPACVAILLIWVYAAGGLFLRDILPDLWVTPPPDLRSMATAGELARPTDWELSVADDGKLRKLLPVGRARTSANRLPDGGTELIGQVSFDSGNLLKGSLIGQVWFDSGNLPKRTSPEPQRSEHFEVNNRLEIDPSGNLKNFRVVVRSVVDDRDVITFDGQVKGRVLEVQSRSPDPQPILNRKMSFAYEPRGMVQNLVGPIDRLPGLQVGQRWVSRVVNPLTGLLDEVKFEVSGKHTIQWNNAVVPTLVVVQRMGLISMRTWVRKDGLVLRQEIPLPTVTLILERVPDQGERGQVGVTAP